MTDTQPPISLRELRERWSLSPNALKARAKALGIELLRPSGNTAYWPGDKLELGDQLHEWIKEGHAVALFPAVQEVAGTDTSLTRQKAVADTSVTTALVPVRQRMQELRQEDPLALARRLVEASNLGVPLTNQEMAEVLGVSSVSKDKDGSSPRPGFTLQRIEHNGTPFWMVHRASAGAPVTATSLPTQTDRHVGFAACLAVVDVPSIDCTGSDLFHRMRL